MGSPQGGEERKRGNIESDYTQHSRASFERGHPAQGGPQSTAPIEMTAMDESPQAPASRNPQWPLNPGPTEAIQESQGLQSAEDSQPETSALPVTTPTFTPLREPLAITSANAGPAPIAATPYPLTREKTGPAIDSPGDRPIQNPQESDLVGFSLLITLLLTNGARHPFKIDEKYLKKRSVNVDGGNPVNLSVYTLKELIWREWRDGKSRAVHGDLQTPFNTQPRLLLTSRKNRMGVKTFKSKLNTFDILWETSGG
ncbi:MAG: hypothetical protein Q9208_008475 [Pyrenodesmia sp. 3 TL-2023]